MSQVQAARVGMTEYQQRLKGWEAGQHEEWERTRWLAWHQYNLSPFLKSAHRPRTPQDLAPFPWEDAPKPKKVTRKMAKVSQAEQDALNAIMKDFYQRKYSC